MPSPSNCDFPGKRIYVSAQSEQLDAVQEASQRTLGIVLKTFGGSMAAQTLETRHEDMIVGNCLERVAF